jgi:hypothetical protein
MKTFFEQVYPLIQKYHKQDNVEFELRLGKINRGSFDTNVGKETFDKILTGLEKYKGWEKVSETSDVCYYHENIRLTIDDNSEESKQVVKQKLEKVDQSFSGRPLDVRFAIAKETPFAKDDIEFSMARQRHRKSFVRKGLTIDMTIVSGNPADMDSEEEETYQVELEFLHPIEDDKNKIYNMFYKVSDVLDIISARP